MGRSRYGVALTVAGLLTLPFGVGIPLLATGVLLLARGDRLDAGRWIRALFWAALACLALTGVLLLVVDREGQPNADAAIGASIVTVAPALLAALIGVSMAALTVARFHALSLKERIMGLSFGAPMLLGLGGWLVAAFPWPMLGLVGLLLCVRFVVWRRRRHARRAEAVPAAPGVASAPERSAVSPPLLAPAARAPHPPRARRRGYGLAALIALLLAVPLGLLVIHGLSRVMDTSGFAGMGAGLAILGLGIGVAMLALAASAVLAVIWLGFPRRSRSATPPAVRS